MNDGTNGKLWELGTPGAEPRSNVVNSPPVRVATVPPDNSEAAKLTGRLPLLKGSESSDHGMAGVVSSSQRPAVRKQPVVAHDSFPMNSLGGSPADGASEMETPDREALGAVVALPRQSHSSVAPVDWDGPPTVGPALLSAQERRDVIETDRGAGKNGSPWDDRDSSGDVGDLVVSGREMGMAGRRDSSRSNSRGFERMMPALCNSW
eukprot:Gregarina_sp_Poly_1__6116@NODE_322_length_9532_cov_315_419546_g274_i0_p7_GENE_NODE_322_length_9532_cov_315_419546_g274_i0NODE_322_length_9532_cov_315_419546_g274_i0_p7_ORF_typecomplete_len207_score32_66RhlB/PF12300_8/0_12_NODE_322_length_9532_cov_315_419546_g274_i045065126